MLGMKGCCRIGLACMAGLLLPGGPLVLLTEFDQRHEGYPRGMPWIVSWLMGAIGFGASVAILMAMLPGLHWAWIYLISNFAGSLLVGPQIIMTASAALSGILGIFPGRERSESGSASE